MPLIFFFKQKTAYEMRISDWSSDVCSSDLEHDRELRGGHGVDPAGRKQVLPVRHVDDAVGVRGRLLEHVEVLEIAAAYLRAECGQGRRRSEERRVGKESGSTGRSRGAPYH